MSIITRMRKQKAVYWARLANDRFGKPTWDLPVQIDCRWEDGAMFDKTGHAETQNYDARVYVDRDVTLGGMLMLGVITSGMDSDPRENNAKEIQKFDKLPNLRNTEYLRTAYLKFGA